MKDITQTILHKDMLYASLTERNDTNMHRETSIEPIHALKNKHSHTYLNNQNITGDINKR